jgi:glycerol-3-phosphate dehydrogenase
MQRIQTDILVIGGGATGTGVLRDLAMRGFKCILVERRDLAYGTTGRYHGLLHSGGRYVVKDPQAAKECYEENQILRRIMPQCIEDTGGFFVLTPQDDPAYVQRFLEGCQKAGIPTESIPIHQMLIEEPLLDPNIQQCFHLPDASADSFLAANLNVESARQYGATFLTYHEVERLLVSNQTLSSPPTVVGALCHDLIKDEAVQIDASMVVNASGAWAGAIANTIGINLVMLPGKGTMLALNHRVVNTIINRCKLPSDGDILVPAHSVAVMGTTDIRVSDPDHYSIEPWEIRMLMDEGEKIIPIFKQFRILRAWAGVRPLIQETSSSKDREISRAFVLLDHAQRDGVEGLVTITSGKWTTYRKMAQVTSDKICEKLKVDRPCRTSLEILPSPHNKTVSYHYLGTRLNEIEEHSDYGQLICECELVTVRDIEQAIVQSNAATLDDIRRHTRLGMGPCQGVFCTFRAAGMLHALKHHPISEINVALRDFLQERWKGDLPILKGQQMRQARFNELIYIDTLNAPNLPGERVSKLASQEYTKPAEVTHSIVPNDAVQVTKYTSTSRISPQDAIVIGAGVAGLITAWRAGLKGRKINVVTKGWGATYWNTGCIDIFGYQPPNYLSEVDSPIGFLEKLITSNPEHPYALAGLPVLENAVQSFLALCQDYKYPFHGSLDKNILLPTSLGTLRPSCLIPETMIAGNTSERSPMLIVGFSRFYDFFPNLIADNLNAQNILSLELTLDLPSLRDRKFINGMVLARLFDNSDFRQEVIDTLKPKLGGVGRVGFPAVLGLENPMKVLEHLQSSLGIPVFEIPGLPPSIPGIRLHNLLASAIERDHGMIHNGMLVSTVSGADGVIQAIWSEAASRLKSHQAKNYVLATGGILGGGIIADNNGYAQESIFGLPVNPIEQPTQWLQNEFLSSEAHPINRVGVRVDDTFHPIDITNQRLYQNLYVVGGTLGNCDPLRERSLEGIALATGYTVGEAIAGSETG